VRIKLLRMRTTLNLLTRNGAVYMDFHPALNGPQYTRLLQIAIECGTEVELRKTVAEWAKVEGLEVSLKSDCPSGEYARIAPELTPPSCTT
jgi:hypothetical protein